MRSVIDRRGFLGVVGGAAAVSQVSTPSSLPGPRTPRAPPRSRAASSWIDSLPCSTPIFLRPRKGNKDAVFPLKPDTAAARRLEEFRDAGIGMVEVYAPAEAGNSFLGLDTINRYRVDPRIGTMDDFRRLVDLAHAKGLKIISIDNLGYCSVEAVDFLKACDDVKAGRDTREARMFSVGRFGRTRRLRRAPAGPTDTSWSARRTLGDTSRRSTSSGSRVRAPASTTGPGGPAWTWLARPRAPAAVQLVQRRVPGGVREDRPLLDGHRHRRDDDRRRQLVRRLRLGEEPHSA